MDAFLFEIPVSVAIERINLVRKSFSLLHKGEMVEISVTDTMRTVAKDSCCCFCGAKATKAFVFDTGARKIVRFFTEKNGELVLFTKDHKIPKSKGGKDKLFNYQTSCERCNNLKGNVSKDNQVSQLVIELRQKVFNQKSEITKLIEAKEDLEIENLVLENELSEIRSCWFVKIFLFIKNIFSEKKGRKGLNEK